MRETYEAPEWQIAPPFLYRYVKGEIEMDAKKFYLQLLDADGYQITHPDYEPGGKVVEFYIEQSGPFTQFHMRPQSVTWKVKSEEKFAVSAITIYSEFTLGRMAGLDFPHELVTKTGYSFTVQSNEQGVLGIHRSVIEAMRYGIEMAQEELSCDTD